MTTTRATECATCGSDIEPTTGRGRPRLYCSGMCRGRAYLARHYNIRVEDIIDRWGNECYLCRKPVSLHEPFGPQSANIDHIIPRSAGGASTLENLRLVHYVCNLRKGASLVCPHCRHTLSP